MNEKHIDPEPSLDLPPPRLEQNIANNEVDTGGYSGEAERSAAIEAGSSGDSGAFLPPQQQTTDDDNALAQQAGSMAMGGEGMPAIADDIDLIEREWVHKAKEIVEHTRGDPYKRTKEMNKVKADYLKKRYNKDLELEDK